MPIVRHFDDTASIELDEMIAFIEDNAVDPRNEDDMLAAAPLLKRLGNNRSFIADMALKELKARNNLDAIDHNYTPQTIMLTPANKRWFMRCNFWPSASDHIFRSSGAKAFFYFEPHDHNFNFLTVGYKGPGYKSDYYEYDYDDVLGYPGEAVPLRFVESSALEEGKVMLYRAFRDVHDQRPGDAMSMSINIMENSLRGNFMDQYGFDTKTMTVSGILNRIGATALLPILAVAGEDDGNTLDFLTETARGHVSGRVRTVALNALAGVQPDALGAIAVHQGGLTNDDPQVRGFCRERLARLEALVA
ncbi:hypothetical protein GCM10007973_12560 [Polymorphobacter multimanifer]|uniref:Uncharacterized protein n=1 Tax=Polymorphobacter multimanifer TaxID=1070431 RepID=A0A841LA68_9SPHN|nr:transposase [Polymorphobacter multimanifer]MBB6229036.1 hypothetical protein [Polymorphobacter multimanifer]GGI77150.1 hypothetical protein GCM10007973_12560 [Polymorphobacter multimanifer]